MFKIIGSNKSPEDFEKLENSLSEKRVKPADALHEGKTSRGWPHLSLKGHKQNHIDETQHFQGGNTTAAECIASWRVWAASPDRLPAERRSLRESAEASGPAPAHRLRSPGPVPHEGPRKGQVSLCLWGLRTEGWGEGAKRKGEEKVNFRVPPNSRKEKSLLSTRLPSRQPG